MADLAKETVKALVEGRSGDPFSVLGMHMADKAPRVRVFEPGAAAVTVLDRDTGETAAELEKIDPAGLFAGAVPGRETAFPYLLDVTVDGTTIRKEDPYRFPPILSERDTDFLAEGNHLTSYEKLGAHPTEMEGVAGTSFAVWAPNAQRVSVVGDFNDWDERRHPMRLRPDCGVWEIFLPGVGPGAYYKYALLGPDGTRLPLKADPYGFRHEEPPGFASQVHALTPLESPAEREGRVAPLDRDAPISIYEVHPGSWQRRAEAGERYLTYRELADELVPYVRDMGFTHVEFLPINEHPFDGSWGYQPLGLFAPTSRFGTPEDFQHLVEAFHEAGIGVLLDWVPGHFPADEHGLALFDGTALYEHQDPRKGRHKGWGTLIYNFGRAEVANFLISNALFWLNYYGIQGLRVDAVASMLYLDYDREEGEWAPNEFGGNENLEAVRFIRRFNEAVYATKTNVATAAEESTAWPMVSGPTYIGGLGFGYKWNMGWMNDTLQYMQRDPLYRHHHHGQLTFGLVYAYNENFILPLSHDEVVHEKGSLIGKMPGDEWQKFANLRAYFAFMFTHPGKKLLFMGGELAQVREWDHDRALDWHLLEAPRHKAVQDLMRELNRLYRQTPALYALDCEPAGFEWIDSNDADNCVLSYIRKSGADDFVIVVCNFTPVVRYAYRIGVPQGGRYREILNTDSEIYGGSNVGNMGAVTASEVMQHGRSHSIDLTLPPLAAIILAPEEA